MLSASAATAVVRAPPWRRELLITFAVVIMCGDVVVLAADTFIELPPNDETARPGTGRSAFGGSKICQTVRGFLTGYGRARA